MGHKSATKHVFPMPRTAFVLLILCVILSILPHIERVPAWMLVVFFAILGWRVQVFRQRLRFPPRWLRLFLVSGAFLGVVYHHGTIFGPDAGVGLLITAYLFKQLEMYTKRDAFLVVVLSYFVLATEFLFSKSLFTTLYILTVLVFITAALIALNQSDSNIAIWKPLKSALVFTLQAVPLMVVLFFLFPRIGPIWELNLQTQSSKTGLSDRVTPGDIAELSRSNELAFRVEFEGDTPAPKDRYWRALVFDRFDGNTWYSVETSNQLAYRPDNLETKSAAVNYRVFLEATGQNWLIAAPWAQIQDINHYRTNSLMYYVKDSIDHPVSYNVSSYFDYQYEADGLTRELIDRYTGLPARGNQQSAQFARQLFQNSGRNPEQFSDALLSWFFREAFYYTLNPPKLSGDSIDQFLFSTRRGFCSHYAGAFVYLMRSAGIPARMIGGYQGGQPHPIGRYLLVHQYDAHAWAEYWVIGKGWVRVDPTAAVAPSRIEMGSLSASLDQQSLADSPFSPDKLRNIPILNRLRLMADYVDYLWFKNVVSFNEDSQADLFRQILGQVTPQRIAILIGSVAGAVLAIMAVWILMTQKPIAKLSQADKAYLRFIHKLQRKGLIREIGEGMNSFSQRALTLFPEQKENIIKISDIYMTIQYRNKNNETNLDAPDQSYGDKLRALEKQLISEVKRFRPKS
jgi:transglutaminase-like putative cysteine protease